MSYYKGIKHDAGKTRYDLVPPEFMDAVGNILTFGAEKYTDRNWEGGMDWSRYFAALQRHMWAWWGGEDIDQDSGKSHLWHASACLTFLVTYEAREIGQDDRPINK